MRPPARTGGDSKTAKQPLNGPVFVATGESGMRVFSQDGKTWTYLQTDREGVLLKYVCSQKGRCFTGGQFGGELVTCDSAEGVNWNTGKLACKPYAERLEHHAIPLKRRTACAIVQSRRVLWFG